MSVEGDVLGGERLIAQDDVGRLLRQHDHRGEDVRVGDVRHDGGVHHAQAIEAAHAHGERVDDRVLVDAPCSGMGTLRRNPDLKWRQTPAGILDLNQKQMGILDSAARLLKPGGRLVYATCSLLPQENQAIAESFLLKHPEFDVIPAAEVLKSLFPKDKLPLGCSADNPWWQLWPHIHGTDGFFGAIFQRKAVSTDSSGNDRQEKEVLIKAKKPAKD